MTSPNPSPLSAERMAELRELIERLRRLPGYFYDTGQRGADAIESLLASPALPDVAGAWRPEFSKIKCRFGCDNLVGIFHVPAGCVDWIVRPDLAGAGEQDDNGPHYIGGSLTSHLEHLLARQSDVAGAGERFFGSLRAANTARQQEWDPDSQITLAYRGNEIAGELGEACNVIKKLERERLGIRGSRATKEQLAEELADVVICADLIAMQVGIDLDVAIEAKFNATSEKYTLSTRLETKALTSAHLSGIREGEQEQRAEKDKANLRFTAERWGLAFDIWERLKQSIAPTYTLAECLETTHLSSVREGREEAAKVAEFGEYLAKRAEQFMNHVNDVWRLYASDGDTSDPWRGLRSAIYEFRKRAAKVLPLPPAGETT